MSVLHQIRTETEMMRSLVARIGDPMLFTETLELFLNRHRRKPSGIAGTGPCAVLLLFLFVGVLGPANGSGAAVLLRPRRGTSGDETDLRVRKPKLRRPPLGLGGVDAVDTTSSTAAARLCAGPADMRGSDVKDRERGRADVEPLTGRGTRTATCRRPSSSTVHASSPDASVTSGEPGIVASVCPRGYDGVGGAERRGLAGVLCEPREDVLCEDWPELLRECDLVRAGRDGPWGEAEEAGGPDAPLNGGRFPALRSVHERRLPAAVLWNGPCEHAGRGARSRSTDLEDP
jgi:hypothetical protein